MGQAKKRKRLAGRGSVLLIAGLFLGSAGLRVSLGANAAWAENDFARELLTPVMQKASDIPDTGARAEMADLLDALQSREAAVEAREEQLDVRAQSLDVAQQEVERRIEALEAAEQRLSATLALADSAAEDDLARLTTVYENMKPKEAAALFQAMEPAFAAGFLARMRPDSAAKILAGLEPQNAYSISAILAGRNASAPKN